MEVEVLVSYSGKAKLLNGGEKGRESGDKTHLSHCALVGFLDGLFMAFVVYKADQTCFAIKNDLLLQMLLGSFQLR